MAEVTEASALLEIDGSVATLRFNEPAKMNALTPALLEASLKALQQVSAEPSVRALVLTGRGRAFCVGADLAHFQRFTAGDATLRGNELARLMDEGGTPLMLALRNLPVPVVCALNGPTAGGGVGLALVGDIVLAARSAYFYLPFLPALGLVPDMASAWQMARSVGMARTAGLALLGDRLSAEQAAAWGLIWSCVDDDHLQAEARRVADRLAALPAHAIGEWRALQIAASRNSLPQQLQYERDRQYALIQQTSFAEGLAAFAERRAPAFAGRALCIAAGEDGQCANE